MTLSGAFYRLTSAGFSPRQALALTVAGYDVLWWQRVEFVDPQVGVA